MEQLFDYLAQCEMDLVYGAALGAIKEDPALEIPEAVLKVVTHPQLGHKANATNLDPNQWMAHVRRQVDKRDRLLFVIPACPFKDQNPLRTLSGPAHPDAGEVAFLVNQHILSLALYQVHPFGADWVILADGVLYAEVFGVPTEEAARYREILRHLRTALNLQGTVSIIDLSELIAHFAVAAGEDRIEGVKQRVRALVRSPGQDPTVVETVRVLRRGMRKNLATRSLLERFDLSDVWTLLNVGDRESVPETLHEDWDTLEARAGRAAEEYAAVNLMLRWFDIVARCFPDSLRATVHPKPGQLAVRSNGSAYPWNATAVRTEARTPAELIRSEPLQGLADKGPFVAVNLGDPEHGGLLYLEAP
jgi:pyoverdine/dityrosine biosynthesis protein Dit1